MKATINQYCRHRHAARLALALAAAAGAPAHAQSSNSADFKFPEWFQPYGYLFPLVESANSKDATSPVHADGATQVPAAAYTGFSQPRRTRVLANGSLLGFRGKWGLGNGLAAIWQVESAIPLDGTAGSFGFATRNSHVGLQGGFGTVIVGNWDTPYKLVTGLSIFPLGGGTDIEYANVLGNPGFNVAPTTTQSGRVNGPADAAFDRRQGNSIQYWSPSMGGLVAKLAYSANEQKASTAPTSVGDPKLYSLSLQYDKGPFSVRYGYERHNDYFGLAQLGGSAAATATNRSSKDDAHKVAFIYNDGTNKAAIAVERLHYDTDETAAGGVNMYRRNAAFALVQRRIAGPHSVWASFGKAQAGVCEQVDSAACSTNGLGSKMFGAGYLYEFNKDVTAFVQYGQVKNERSASYGFFPALGGSGNGGTSTAPGTTSRALGVGLKISFGY